MEPSILYKQCFINAVTNQHCGVVFLPGSPAFQKYGQNVTGHFILSEQDQLDFKNTLASDLPLVSNCYFKVTLSKAPDSDGLLEVDGFSSADIDKILVKA